MTPVLPDISRESKARLASRSQKSNLLSLRSFQHPQAPALGYRDQISGPQVSARAKRQNGVAMKGISQLAEQASLPTLQSLPVMMSCMCIVAECCMSRQAVQAVAHHQRCSSILYMLLLRQVSRNRIQDLAINLKSMLRRRFGHSHALPRPAVPDTACAATSSPRNPRRGPTTSQIRLISRLIRKEQTVAGQSYCSGDRRSHQPLNTPNAVSSHLCIARLPAPSQEFHSASQGGHWRAGTDMVSAALRCSVSIVGSHEAAAKRRS